MISVREPQIGEPQVFVHPEHAALVQQWRAAESKYGGPFVLIVVFAPLGILAFVGITALVSPALLLPAIGFLLLAIAALIARFPFATTQTVNLLGLRRSIIIVRIGAAIIGALGLLLLVEGTWPSIRAA